MHSNALFNWNVYHITDLLTLVVVSQVYTCAFLPTLQ